MSELRAGLKKSEFLAENYSAKPDRTVVGGLKNVKLRLEFNAYEFMEKEGINGGIAGISYPGWGGRNRINSGNLSFGVLETKAFEFKGDGWIIVEPGAKRTFPSFKEAIDYSIEEIRNTKEISNQSKAVFVAINPLESSITGVIVHFYDPGDALPLP